MIPTHTPAPRGRPPLDRSGLLAAQSGGASLQPRGVPRAAVDRRLVEQRALGKLLAAANPMTEPSSLIQQTQLMDRREPLLQAHDQLVKRCEWLRELATGTHEVQSGVEGNEAHMQLKKWSAYAEQKLGQDVRGHSELVEGLTADAKAFSEEMMRLKACTTLEVRECLGSPC